MRRVALATFAVVVLAGVAASCGGEPDETAAVREPFIAFERDFQGFRGWESFSYEGSPDAEPAHLLGPRTVYRNKKPEGGSYPVGTILVKELGEGSTHAILARVKRGGGFDPGGVAGWEWFGLEDRANGTTAITWRGFGPPADEMYGGDPSGCSPCHAHGKDGVLSEPILP